jgi:hypothetical protein
MQGNILPAPAGQVAPTLTDLAEAIRAARADAAADFSRGTGRVREIGDKLRIAKAMAGHGRWGEFLKACNLNDRTAQRYMQFADLIAANPYLGTDLIGLSIKAAIKLLSPKPPKTAPTPKSPIKSAKTIAPAKPGHKVIRTAIIEAWLAASPADRTKAIDSIGLDAILAALPPTWLPLLADRLTTRQAVTPEAAVDPALIPSDLSIPPFLDRRPAPQAVEEGPPVVTATTDLLVPTPESVTPPSPTLKTKRSPTRHRDPLDERDWRRLDADDLESAIADAQRYGINEHANESHDHKESRLRQLGRMHKRLAELRATEKRLAS